MSLALNILSRLSAKNNWLILLENPDGFLMGDNVRSAFQAMGVEVISGSQMELRIHFETVRNSVGNRIYIYITKDINRILPDIRSMACVATFAISDMFPLFMDKSVLARLPLDVLEILFNEYSGKRVSLFESRQLIDSINRRTNQYRQNLASECVNEFLSINPDWTTKASGAMQKVSALMLKALRNGVYESIAEPIARINEGFQQWIDRSYFAMLNSNPLLAPRSVNKILPHIEQNNDRNSKVALVVVDGLSYWQYTILRDRLDTFGISCKEATTLSWLPSITMLSRQAIFRGDIPQGDYKQNPQNEQRLWTDYWSKRGFLPYQIQYISDTQNMDIQPTTTRLALVSVEMDEKMHSCSVYEDLLTLTENWSQRFAVTLRDILEKGFVAYLTTDHGSVLSEGWRSLMPAEKTYLYKDGSRGARHLIYTDSVYKQTFAQEAKSCNMLDHGNWLCMRDARCLAKNGMRMITHGGSHFQEVVIPFTKIQLN